MDADAELRIEEAIRTSFVEEGVALFWPEQFVELGLVATHAEATAALLQLAHSKKLVPTVQIRALRHICWSGTLSDYAAARYADRLWCRTCEKPLTQRPTIMFFELSSEWREVLKDSKKKWQVAG